jgi:hypothetical protein
MAIDMRYIYLRAAEAAVGDSWAPQAAVATMVGRQAPQAAEALAVMGWRAPRTAGAVVVDKWVLKAVGAAVVGRWAPRAAEAAGWGQMGSPSGDGDFGGASDSF